MRIVIWDSQPIMRLALASLIETIGGDWEAVCPAPPDSGAVSPPQAIEEHLSTSTLENLRPFDMVICDPRASAFAYLEQKTIQAIKQAIGPVPLVVFTASEHPEDIRSALSAGASAYVPKSTDTALLGTIIRLVHAGGLYVPPSLAYSLNAQPTAAPQMMAPTVPSQPPAFPPPSAQSSLPDLTQRQYQVLHLLSEGLSNAEIGERLGLNISTVKSHVTSVLKTLGVERRTQAVLLFKNAEWSHS